VQNPISRKRIPTWLWWIAWLGFGFLSLAFMLVVARWWVMRSGHQEAMRIVNAQREKPAAQVLVSPMTPTMPKVKSEGIPLSSLPHFGEFLTGDDKKWARLREILQDIQNFALVGYTHPGEVMSFRRILPALGFTFTETRTEAEAAAIVLKRAERFSNLLDQWREAVSKGPMEQAAASQFNQNIGRIDGLASSMMSLMQLTGEAHLAVGDTESAWADWQTMKNSRDRLAEIWQGDTQMDFRMFELACSGVRTGSWTDHQLSEISTMVSGENALTSMRQNLEREKESITQYYTNFNEHKEQFAKDFMSTPSPFDQMMNQVKLKLITEQQIQDNMDVKLHEIDQMLSRFDPDTGYYVQPTEEERTKSSSNKNSSDPLGSFYFMIKDLNNGGDDSWAARSVIYQQAQYDQFRLAAALETYQRRTGNYPDDLNAISDKFPGGMPRDLATGQLYFYQRGEEGFKLWSTGIDGTSEGGDETSDVTWTHRRPSKF
jgi:RNA polymerase-binding transcription factor DksA